MCTFAEWLGGTRPQPRHWRGVVEASAGSADTPSSSHLFGLITVHADRLEVAPDARLLSEVSSHSCIIAATVENSQRKKQKAGDWSELNCKKSWSCGGCLLQNSTESCYLRVSSSDAFSWFWDREGEAFSNSEFKAYLFRIFEKKGVLWCNISRDHLRTHALRLQPGVKSVQRGEFKQVWLHPQEMWCL